MVPRGVNKSSTSPPACQAETPEIAKYDHSNGHNPGREPRGIIASRPPSRAKYTGPGQPNQGTLIGIRNLLLLKELEPLTRLRKIPREGYLGLIIAVRRGVALHLGGAKPT